MNVLRDFNPVLFTLLDEPIRQLSKAQLARILDKFVRLNNFEITENNIRYIDCTSNIMYELTGLTELYILYRGNVQENEWWDFVTIIYKKWKL